MRKITTKQTISFNIPDDMRVDVPELTESFKRALRMWAIVHGLELSEAILNNYTFSGLAPKKKNG